MTAAVVDVNEAFAAEKTDQVERFKQRVADGEIVKQPDGRYKIMVGRDAGEYLTDELKAITDLDVVNDKTAVYASVPMWHGLGQYVPGGVTDIDEVLQLGGIDWDVVKRPVLYDRFENRDGMWVPMSVPGRVDEAYVNVRTDLQTPVGVVGGKYEVLQNRESFEFLQILVNEFGMTWESAGGMRGGSKTFVSMELPESVEIELFDGRTDEIKMFVVALNSHDGSTNFRCVVTPWRPVCGNTERFAVRDAVTSWGIRHTKSARERMHQARKTLGLSVKYAERFAVEEQLLARQQFEIDEFRELTAELWPEPKSDQKAANTRWQQKQDELASMYWANADTLGGTRYAAERTVTQYCDWAAPVRAGRIDGKMGVVRATRVLEGADDDRKSMAHRLLLTRTNR
jgi:phage/plasmid-like protein (TIGR03299 family)